MSSKTKISDTQSNLSELNIQMDSIKKSLNKKMTDSELLEKHLRVRLSSFATKYCTFCEYNCFAIVTQDYSESIKKISQEKLYLSEKLKSLNQDNPFAEAYRNESIIYKQEQAYMQQIKDQADKLEADVNAIRMQTEYVKHEIDTIKSEMVDLNKENDHLNSLLMVKRNDFKLKYPSMPSAISQTMANFNSQHRSATPKGISVIILIAVQSVALIYLHKDTD
jgi:hypothetical protein